MSKLCYATSDDESIPHLQLYPEEECPGCVSIALTAISEEQRANRIKHMAREELERQEARRMANTMEAEKTFRAPIIINLATAMLLPEVEEPYAIQDLLPLEGNAMFSAVYKGGKTTITTQLARSYADGTPFLNHFEVHPPAGRNVTMFNFEMSGEQYTRWLRRGDIRNPEKINLVHLRGLSIPFTSEPMQDRIVKWLKDADTGLWIIDTASRAFNEGDINNNSDVNRFLAAVSSIKSRAGVRDIVVLHHIPHSQASQVNTGGEIRAIGAVAWSAWSDANWHLTKGDDTNPNARYFSATGRDVDVPQALISYDETTMTNTYTGASMADVSVKAVADAVFAAIEHQPGVSRTDLKHRVTARDTRITEAIQFLMRENRIEMRTEANGKLTYYPLDNDPMQPPTQANVWTPATFGDSDDD